MALKALATTLNEIGKPEWLSVLTWVESRFHGIDWTIIDADDMDQTLEQRCLIIAESAATSTYPTMSLTHQLSRLPCWFLRVTRRTQGKTEYWSPFDCSYEDFVAADTAANILLRTAPSSYPPEDILRNRLSQRIPTPTLSHQRAE